MLGVRKREPAPQGSALRMTPKPPEAARLFATKVCAPVRPGPFGPGLSRKAFEQSRDKFGMPPDAIAPLRSRSSTRPTLM